VEIAAADFSDFGIPKNRKLKLKLLVVFSLFLLITNSSYGIIRDMSQKQLFYTRDI
jgi:hypothetical protein